MKTFLTYLIAVAFLVFASIGLGEDEKKEESAMQMTGTAKIIKGPEVITVPTHTVATAHVKAKDYTPAEGYGDKGYDAAYENMVINGFDKLSKWMQETNCHPTGPGFAVWFESPETTKPMDLTAKTGFPVAASCEPNRDVMIETVPEHQAASLTYTGDYKNSGNAWNDLMKWVSDNGYEFDGNPVEKYIKGPHETQNPEEWTTEILWQVKKKSASGESDN
jgi:effector-binding domain-containing protein